MKKAIGIILVLALCLGSLVSCGKDKTVAHVTTFDEFKTALEQKDEKGYKTIILDNDIEWDMKNYPGGDGASFSADATGLVIDLGGFTIKGVGTNAFNLTGDSFTVKNGKVTAWVTNSKYAMNINYCGTNAKPDNQYKQEALDHKPASYSDSDPVWAKRIILEDLEVAGTLIGYSTVEIKNCTFDGGVYRGLVLQGTSGTVENVKAYTVSEGAGSAGFVIHSYGKVTVKANSTLDAKGKFGIYVACCGEFEMEDGATVIAGGFNTYGLYVEKQGTAVLKSGATLNPAIGRAAVYIRTGSSVTLEKGVVVNTTGDVVDDNASVGAYDDTWTGYGLANVFTDNR